MGKGGNINRHSNDPPSAPTVSLAISPNLANDSSSGLYISWGS